MAKSRDELLRLATDHVVEHGVAGFSLRSCAEAIGTSHRMLSYHFGSRRGLLKAITENVTEPIQQMLVGLAEATPQARADADAYVASDRARRDARLVVESAYLRLADPSYGSYQEVMQRWSRTANLLTGAADPDGPPTPRARLLIAAMMGLIVDLSGGAPPAAIQAAGHELISLMPLGSEPPSDRDEAQATK